MQIPLEITFRDVPKTNDVETLINEKVEKLGKVCDYFTSCRVAIEKPQQHQRTGNPYRVRIVIMVPHDNEVVVIREPSQSGMHVPLSSVVRDAFETAHRKLRKLVERRYDGKKNL